MNLLVAKIAAAPLAFLLVVAVTPAWGQGLSPRAYVITPIHANAVTFTYGLQDGNIVLDQSLPVSNSHGRVGTELVSYFHTMDFIGHSSNINISLPYSIGHFQGDVSGVQKHLYRSGLAPLQVRLSVNLIGAPAMSAAEFQRWRQKTLLGVSFSVIAPTGQYDPARLINIGGNRWAFKPEIGLSRRWGSWILDVYGSIWFFTENDNFYTTAPNSMGPNRQTQKPMGATESHLSYDVKPRFWISLDGNYWYGGETSVNGVPTPTTVQANSRLGVTAAIPVSGHQSLKFSYSGGTYITFGGNYQTVSAAWQYSWQGRPN